MYDNNGDLTPEYKAQAEELVGRIGTICKEYHPAIVLFVLEAAMSAQISSFSPPIGDLFAQMMLEYKNKAAILLSVAELLKGKMDEIRSGASIEELLKTIQEEQESNPQE